MSNILGKEYHIERHDVVRLIPDSARSVLDIGCAFGDTAVLLKRRNPHVRIVGVEVNPDQAAIAERVLDEVHVCTIEDIVDQLPDAAFDCIVMGDVLEHLMNPWEVLLKLKRCLRSQGVVVASVPNVQHYWVWLPLILRGKWTYTEHGLLDSGHLRFFSRSTLIDMFRWAGYHPQIKGVNYLGASLLQRLNRLTRGALTGYLAVQYLLVAAVAMHPGDTTAPFWTPGNTIGAWEAARPRTGLLKRLLALFASK